MHKKGQISYEYIIVIGMLLVLVIPFFYSFIVGVTGGLGVQANQDMVTRVAQASKTIAHLGGVGSKMLLPARFNRLRSNDINGANLIAVTNANGEFITAEGAPKLYAGIESFTGSGVQRVPIIKTYLESIVVGDAPALVGICPEDVEYPTTTQCGLSTVPTNEGFQAVGANLKETKLVALDKISNKKTTCDANPQCQVNGDCAGNEFCNLDICQCITLDICETAPECLSDADCGGTTPYCFPECVCADITPPVIESLGGGNDDLILQVGAPQTGVGTFRVGVLSEVQGTELHSRSKYLVIIPPSGEGEEPV